MKRLVQILTKLNPSYTPQKGDHYEMELPNKSGIPAVELFKEKRALSTVMIWATFFMCLLMVYGLNTWLPKLMETAGYQLGSSLLFLLVLNAGAIFGAIFGGWASDHWNGRKVLISFFVIAAISLSLLGFKSNIIGIICNCWYCWSYDDWNANCPLFFCGAVLSYTNALNRGWLGFWSRPIRCGYRTSARWILVNDESAYATKFLCLCDSRHYRSSSHMVST